MSLKALKFKSRRTGLQREIDWVIGNLVHLRSAPICREKVDLEADPERLQALSDFARRAASVFDQLFQEIALESGLALESERWSYANVVGAAVETSVVCDIQARAATVSDHSTRHNMAP